MEYVGKDEALRRYRAWATDLAELVNELDVNPLPASLVVFLEPGAGAVETATSIATRASSPGPSIVPHATAAGTHEQGGQVVGAVALTRCRR